MPIYFMSIPCYSLASIGQDIILSKEISLYVVIGMFDYSKAPLITSASSDYYDLHMIITTYI